MYDFKKSAKFLTESVLMKQQQMGRQPMEFTEHLKQNIVQLVDTFLKSLKVNFNLNNGKLILLKSIL